MRKTILAQGEYYHIFNRGIDKQNIFFDLNDWSRFLFLILYFQSPISFFNLSRQSREYVKHRVFNIGLENVLKIKKQRYVELVSFCLMPNHFHLIVKEVQEGGISKYMQRILNAYTKYINTKYHRSGHLFQGPYKAVHIVDDRQLLYLSTYIHKNPTEISGWKNKEDKYEWSSYQDYTIKNRWENLLINDIIIDQFKNKEEYIDFVKSSTAKTIREELDDLLE